MKLVYNRCEEVAKWVGYRLMKDSNAFIPCEAIGIERDGKLIAGVIYNKYEPGLLVEMSIASVDSSWCSRHNLRALFSYPFAQLGLRRVQALCSAKDEGVQMFLKRLGFKQEGVHRCAYHDGSDAVSFGMLGHECKWLEA